MSIRSKKKSKSNSSDGEGVSSSDKEKSLKGSGTSLSSSRKKIQKEKSSDRDKSDKGGSLERDQSGSGLLPPSLSSISEEPRPQKSASQKNPLRSTVKTEAGEGGDKLSKSRKARINQTKVTPVFEFLMVFFRILMHLYKIHLF